MPEQDNDTLDQATIISNLEHRIAYLERRLNRRIEQQQRQERIDDINRCLMNRVGTELEQALRLAKQANKAKTDFLATLSHEIRSPLNIILAMSELLLDTKLDDIQRAYLAGLLAAGRQLFEQLTDVLGFSQLESGLIVVHQEAFAFDMLTTSLQSIMKPLALSKGLTFSLAGPSSSLGERIGDLPKIKQVLFTILDNALKFTDSGRIELVIKANATNPDMVLFSITDTGIGIPSDSLEAIFAPYNQAQNIRTSSRGGVGLGLAICRKMVAALQGEISVVSTLHQGTTFTILLPLPQKADTESSAPRSAPRNINSPQLPPVVSLTILVGENVEGNVEVIRRYLAPYPIDIHYAANGEAAVQLFDTHHYDIVLLDINMPGINGLSAMQRMTELARSGINQDAPIIAMSANAFPEQTLSYLKEGFSGILTKPFTKTALVKTIFTFLGVSPPKDLEQETVDEGVTDRADNSVPASLAPLLDQVITTLEHDLDTLAEHIRNQDTLAVQERCHTAKGLAGLYGLYQFAALLTSLEDQAGNTSELSNQQSLESLRSHLAQFKRDHTQSRLLTDRRTTAGS